MFILILLLCATVTATSPAIPTVDGIDRSGFFNYRRLEFEGRRLFVNIVDTVNSDAPRTDQVMLPTAEMTVQFDDPALRAILPTTVAIGLQPSDKNPEFYGFVSRLIIKALRCMDASDADFEQDAAAPEYVLTVDESNTLAMNDEDSSGDSDALLRKVAVLAGMTEEEASKIELSDCWYVRSPEIMRINVAAGAEPMIRSGWIVERYPLGKFYKTPEPSLRYPVYVTNYSYIDGFSGAIIDVFESMDKRGKRLWTPTGLSTFARTGTQHVAVRQLGKQQPSHFTMFRETASGVLVTTLAQSMSLSYNIGDDAFEERIVLDGHHYHVSCDRKEETLNQRHPASTDIHGAKLSNVAVEITLRSPDDSRSFRCSPKRATATGVPEVLQLDYIEHSGSRSIPSSAREVTVRRMNSRREDATTSGREDEFSPSDETTQRQLTEDEKYRMRHIWDTIPNPLGETVLGPERGVIDGRVLDEEDSLSSLALMLLVVVILALATVICMGACARAYIRKSRNRSIKARIRDQNEKEKRRIQDELAQPSRLPIEDIKNKSEEDEKRNPSSTPSGSNSCKKKSISFAPRKSSMRTEDIVKMISDSELGERIDAMVAAGPDGEEEEKELQPGQQGEAVDAAATAAASEAVDVVDETSVAEKAAVKSDASA